MIWWHSSKMRCNLNQLSRMPLNCQRSEKYHTHNAFKDPRALWMTNCRCWAGLNEKWGYEFTVTLSTAEESACREIWCNMMDKNSLCFSKAYITTFPTWRENLSSLSLCEDWVGGCLTCLGSGLHRVGGGTFYSFWGSQNHYERTQS